MIIFIWVVIGLSFFNSLANCAQWIIELYLDEYTVLGKFLIALTIDLSESYICAL